MKAYFTDSDRDIRIMQSGSICERLHQRVKSAHGNPDLLNQLAREAEIARCILPELSEDAMAESTETDRPDGTTH